MLLVEYNEIHIKGLQSPQGIVRPMRMLQVEHNAIYFNEMQPQ